MPLSKSHGKWPSKPLTAWRVQRLKLTGPPSDSRDPSRKHVRHTGNRRGKLPQVCGSHLEKLLKSMGGCKTVAGERARQHGAISRQAITTRFSCSPRVAWPAHDHKERRQQQDRGVTARGVSIQTGITYQPIITKCICSVRQKAYSNSSTDLWTKEDDNYFEISPPFLRAICYNHFLIGMYNNTEFGD